jgi:hypothetical protein
MAFYVTLLLGAHYEACIAIEIINMLTFAVAKVKVFRPCVRFRCPFSVCDFNLNTQNARFAVYSVIGHIFCSTSKMHVIAADRLLHIQKANCVKSTLSVVEDFFMKTILCCAQKRTSL